MSSVLRMLLVDDEALARKRLLSLLEDIAGDCSNLVVGEAASPAQALTLCATEKPDLVLLDVQMPGMNGIDLARLLSQQAHAPGIIFITAHDEFALQAFEVQAFDYLLKPVRAQRLAQALARVSALRQARPSSSRHFSVHEKGKLLLVPAAQVLFLKAEQKYVSLHTGQSEHLVESSLQSIEDEMPDLFVRVHRNALVNRQAIVGVEKGPVDSDEGEGEKEAWQVILRGTDERLPVSRRQWAVVKGLLKG